MPPTKICSVCKTEKSSEDFYSDRSRPDGLTRRCSACEKARHKERYAADPEQWRAKTREWLKAHPGYLKARLERLNGQPPVRLCRDCGDTATSQRHFLCDACRERVSKRKYPTKKQSATARGYGIEHIKLRREWRLKVATGTVKCARCDGLIDADELWDLGHDDLDRSKYAGPEHRRCNVNASNNLRKEKKLWQERGLSPSVIDEVLHGRND